MYIYIYIYMGRISAHHLIARKDLKTRKSENGKGQSLGFCWASSCGEMAISCGKLGHLVSSLRYCKRIQFMIQDKGWQWPMVHHFFGGMQPGRARNQGERMDEEGSNMFSVRRIFVQSRIYICKSFMSPELLFLGALEPQVIGSMVQTGRC